MSAGERSCIHAATNKGNCPIVKIWHPSTCTVDCRYYKWDRKTTPDTTSKKKKKTAVQVNRQGKRRIFRTKTPTTKSHYETRTARERRRAKRARYVARLGRTEINRRRAKRRRVRAYWQAREAHCLTCGTIHSGWCPPEAFEVVTCYECGNAFLQPLDVGPIPEAHCGQCEAVGKWNHRPATRRDMVEHWRGYGKGVGAPVTLDDVKVSK